MKKEVAIVLAQATQGGVETSLINLLNSTNLQEVHITLFTNCTGNPCAEEISREIEIIDLDKKGIKQQFSWAVKEKLWFQVIKILMAYAKMKITKDEVKKVQAICEAHLLSEKEYDYVIAYKQDYMSIAHALFQLKSDKKILWIHGQLWRGKNAKKTYLEWINCFDKIVCVSETVKKDVLSIQSCLFDKIEVRHNIIDADKIYKLAQETIEEKLELEGIVLVTVGRLVYDKGQMMIPDISKALNEMGIKHSWLIVGDGDIRKQLQEEIRKKGLERNVFLVGEKRNPYCYIKRADIYVSTSLHEGWGLTVQEAKVLCKPIISSNLPVMHEQITHLGNGYLVDDISEKGFVQAISYLYDNPDIVEYFKAALKLEFEKTY